MLEQPFPAWGEAKCTSCCEMQPASQAGSLLEMGVWHKGFLGVLRVLFVTCSLFVIPSVGGVPAPQQAQRNLSVGEELFTNPSCFPKGCPESVADPGFERAGAVGRAGLADPHWGARGGKKQAGSLTLQTPETQQLLQL